MIVSSGKKVSKTLKNPKKMKKFAIIGSVIVMFFIIFFIVIGATGPMISMFAAITMTDGNNIYDNKKEDLPSELTLAGVDTWSADEKRIFEDYKNQKQYYDNNFIEYNAPDILSNKNEFFDISTPFATIHFQGVTNLNSFNDDFAEDVYLELEYNGEGNVEDQHTRNFYKQAGNYTGNNFIIYPGERMLLGHLVSNVVSYEVVQYIEEPCPDGTGICNNASEIYSNWNYIGKITASTVESAKNYYNVSGAIANLNNAISAGKNQCNSDDEWEKLNGCYDKELIYSEILGSDFTDSDSVVDYLQEKYSTDEYTAHVPTGNLINKQYYIAVNVNKKIDYDLYQDYLKEVYIPYIYINCDNCGYKDYTDEQKKDVASSINDDIMSFTNSFKYYNNEDLIGYGITPGNGGEGSYGITASYDCSSQKPGIGDYKNHNGIDVNGVPAGTSIYPLFGGKVEKIVNTVGSESTCHAECNDDGYCFCIQCNGDTMGNYVAIRGIAANGEEHVAYYLHLSGIGPDLVVGKEVTETDVIGYLGTTGCSTGPHLHIDFRDNYYSKYESEYSYGSENNAYKPTAVYTFDAIRSTVCSR